MTGNVVLQDLTPIFILQDLTPIFKIVTKRTSKREFLDEMNQGVSA